MYPRDVKNPLTEDMILKGELEPTNEGYALAKVVTARLCEYISREDEGYQQAGEHPKSHKTAG